MRNCARDLPAGPGTPGGSLYGYNLAEIKNGSWVLGPTGAVMLAGDFDKAMIGIRSDISFKMFTEGVVSDDTGKVILNLMQQDAVAMRMTMRLAYATVNPVTMSRPRRVTARWPSRPYAGCRATRLRRARQRSRAAVRRRQLCRGRVRGAGAGE